MLQIITHGALKPEFKDFMFLKEISYQKQKQKQRLY